MRGTGWVVTATCVMLCILVVPLHAVTDEITERQIEDLDPSPLDSFIEDLHRELDGELPALDLPTIVDRLRRGEDVFSLGQLALVLLGYLGGQVIRHLALVAQLLVLSLLSSLLDQVESAWGGETVSVVARSVIFLALGAVALVTFREAFTAARTTVQQLSDVMLAMLPMLTALLAASGALTTAALFHPAVVFICHIVTQVVVRWAFPLLFAAVMVEIAGHFTPDRPLARLAGLMRRGSLWVLEGAMVLFLGVITVQGAAGAVTDGVTLRGFKFAAKALIPVLGSAFSDAGELVMTSSLLLKNASGLLGLVLVAMIAALPIIRLAVMALAYRFAAAMAAPLGSSSVGDLLDALADGMAALTVAVGAVALMFYLTITIMMGAGNATVMLR